jgi:hypothetical protein
MAYRTLFVGSGIHHSNQELQITHDDYITLHPDNGYIRVELKFAKALPDPMMYLLYLEYECSIRIDLQRTASTDF